MKNLNEYDLSSIESKNDTNQFVSITTNDINEICTSNTNENEFDNLRERFSNNYELYSEESDEEYKTEKLNNNKLYRHSVTHKNDTSHLLLTNTINLYNKNKIRKEYEKWLKENYEMLQSAFYIISNKFLDNGYKKITFKKFTEFCFLNY